MLPCMNMHFVSPLHNPGTELTMTELGFSHKKKTLLYSQRQYLCIHSASDLCNLTTPKPVVKILKVSKPVLFLGLWKANSLWTGLERKPDAYICKAIRLTAAFTINPCDLFQILFCLPISHHNTYNSLSLRHDFAVFYAPQIEGTKRGGQRGVAFVLVSSPH